MKSNTLQHLIVYSIALWLSSVFVIMFWKMFFNQNPDILIKTNNYGEFWIEFFLLNVIFIVLIIFIIKLGIKYGREELKNRGGKNGKASKK